jgi:hypothetical protein
MGTTRIACPDIHHLSFQPERSLGPCRSQVPSAALGSSFSYSLVFATGTLVFPQLKLALVTSSFRDPLSVVF